MSALDLLLRHSPRALSEPVSAFDAAPVKRRVRLLPSKRRHGHAFARPAGARATAASFDPRLRRRAPEPFHAPQPPRNQTAMLAAALAMALTAPARPPKRSAAPLRKSHAYPLSLAARRGPSPASAALSASLGRARASIRTGAARLARALTPGPSFRPADALVFALASLAAAAPLLAPATRAYNPFLERPVIRAERSVVVLPDGAPTLWSGRKYARAERAFTPGWVEASLAPAGPLTVGLALVTPARVVEIEDAPLPALPRLAAMIVNEPGEWGVAPAAGGPEVVAADEAAWTAEQTGYEAEYPTGDIRPGFDDSRENDAPAGAYAAALTLTTPPLAVPRPTLRPEIDPLEEALASVDASAFERSAQFSGEEIDPRLIEGHIDASGERLASITPDSMTDARTADRTTAAAKTGELARVSIVLTAVGINEVASQAALYGLPPEVAIAVAPVGERPQDWARAAHDSGRVVLVEVPMEPASYPRIDPGPLTLLTSASADQNRLRLAAALAEMPGVDGVSTYLGERFKQDRAALDPVLAALKERGLYVFENGHGQGSLLARAAAEAGVPSLSAAVSLDNDGKRRDIGDGLVRLEAEALRAGYAVGVAVALPETVAALAEWTKTAETRGFRLTALRP